MAATKRKPRTIEGETNLFLSEKELAQQQLAEGKMRVANTQLQVHPEMLNEDEIYIDDDIDDVTALNNVLAELGISTEGSKGFITVFKEKIVVGTKGEDYLGKFSVIEYANGNLLDHLQNTFGGGRYHVRVYAPGGRGVVLAANKWIDIAGDAKVVALNVPAAASQQTDLSPVLAAISQQNSNFEKLLATIVSNQPKPKTTAEVLEEMRLMRDIFAPAVTTPVTPPVTQFMDAMKMGMEMATMNAGGDGNNAWAMKAMDMFGKPIMEAVMSGQIKPEVRATPVRALPSPAVVTAPVNEIQTPIEDDAMNLMLKGYLKMLQKAAANNEPTDEYADTILSLLPESSMPEFEGMIRADNWREKMAIYSPAVNQYPDWFTSLRNVLIEFIDADNAELTGGAGTLTPVLTGKLADDSVSHHENDDTGSPKANDHPGGAA